MVLDFFAWRLLVSCGFLMMASVGVQHLANLALFVGAAKEGEPTLLRLFSGCSKTL